MITETEYVQAIADLLNQDPNPKIRLQKIREANRILYNEVLTHLPLVAACGADLALAAADNLGRTPRAGL